MSKSLQRVQAEADRLGLSIDIIETPSGTHTAQMAADFVGCQLGQIAKSVIMRNDENLVMFITSGDKCVDMSKASAIVGALKKADASIIREITGFAIGGVSPLGSLNPVLKYFDQSLMAYEVIYAAAGTPHSLFGIAPAVLQKAINAPIEDFVEG